MFSIITLFVAFKVCPSPTIMASVVEDQRESGVPPIAILIFSYVPYELPLKMAFPCPLTNPLLIAVRSAEFEMWKMRK